FRTGGYPFKAGDIRELNINYASPGYFETLGIPLRQGRTFAATDTVAAPGIVVVNETLARLLFGGSAVGKKITASYDRLLEIVGVVGDTASVTVAEAVPPLVYYPLGQSPSSQMTLVVKTRLAPEQLGETVRRELRATNDNVAVFATRTLRAHVEEALGAE